MASKETHSKSPSADSTNQNITTRGDERKPAGTGAARVINKKPPPPLPPKKSIVGLPASPVTGSEIASTTTAEVFGNEKIPMSVNESGPSSDSKPLASEPSSTAPNGGDLEHAEGYEIKHETGTLDSVQQGAENHEIPPQNLPEKNSQDQDTEQAQGEQQQEKLVATRVGRPYTEKGVNYIIDEAQWETVVPKSDIDSRFAILVEKGGDKKEKLTLASPYLQRVFKAVVKYFPEVVVDNKLISFSEPFAPLYFYGQAMVDYVAEDQDPESQASRGDILPLIYFYEKWVEPHHERVRATLSLGSVLFDHLWALFRPGELLYTLDEFEQPILYMIAACTIRDGAGSGSTIDEFLPLIANLGSRSPARFVVNAWSIEWDGSTRTFSRKTKSMVINSFVGTRNITSLDFYPLSHYKGGDESQITALCSSLEDRGYRWKEMVSETSSCRYHEGPAREVQTGIFKATVQKDKTNLSDRVIVDHDGFNMFGSGEPMLNQVSDFLGPIGELMANFMTNEPLIRGSGFDDLHQEFDHTPPHEPFTKLQAHLCPSTVHCCVLRTKKWFLVTVKNLRDVEWAKHSFDHLVLEESVKQMIQGLVEQHKKNKGRVLSDVIPSKGQGLVIVLHGPPGVGKTLTAESVAEYTQKPLYPINIGELTAEQSVVQRLQDLFLQASRWDAVLLLDEADVVLEKRSYEDLRRNGIVSVFLRMLEYYRGILFLTTNRLGTMDLAFQSRISVAIRYKDLDAPLRRRVWENFIGLLDDSEKEAKNELRSNLGEMETWNLNGRQIRNVLTIAQSLVLARERRRGALTFVDVEQVAIETLKFQDYFEGAYRDSKARLGELTDRQFQEKKAKQLR